MNYSIKELERRSVQTSHFYSGKLVIIRGRRGNPYIDIIKSDGIKFVTIKNGVIDYKRLITANCREERLKVVMESITNIPDAYIDKRIIDIIKYGIDEEDDDF